MKTFNTAFKLTAIAAVALTLVACGGGGGGGSVSAPAPTEPTPAPVVIQAPETTTAADNSRTVLDTTILNQLEAVSQNRTGVITGSNPVASTNTDSRGTIYASIFSGNRTLHSFTGKSSGLNGLVLGAANNAVIAAHNQGWTGKDQNVLIVDHFTPTVSGEVTHGGVVATLAARYAPGANYTSFDTISGGYSNWQVTPINATNFQISDTTILNNFKGINYQVANISLGVPDPTGAQAYKDIFKMNNVIVGTQAQNANGTYTQIYNKVTTSDAVIVKASGNSTLVLGSAAAIAADALTPALMNDAATKNRTLLVGALEHNSAAPSGRIAYYSNKAGIYTSNFVVASGTDPFANYTGIGTSYAAPRVAGYVALVRQKFSAVNGSQAAGIILDTARWNGTWGAKNDANQAIYGKGEASISHALAPTVPLR